MPKATKILVADDDWDIRTFLVDSLFKEGFDVTAVENGEEALSRLTDGKNAPSLAILDWSMPVIDGISLCRRLRKTKDHGLLYIIMITGGIEGHDVVAALDAGADDFLRKPFRKQELLARVRSGQRILTLSHEKIAMFKQLQEQQRLESIGQLAAGIAHELNTPMQYIGDNTRFIQDSLADILKVIGVVRTSAEKVRTGTSCDEAVYDVEQIMKETDLEYLLEQIPLAVAQSLDGIGRVTQIVRAMKEFAHPGFGDEAVSVDLNHLLETVAIVTRNEWKYVADLEKDFAASLPNISCYPSALHQAVINLIVNAAHSIEEKQKHIKNTGKGRIRISTAMCGEDAIEIRISDTGCGIPLEIRGRVMDPFFTTKGVGRGTGQGLAVARSAVADKHGGTLEFETEEGVGTTFVIRIPLQR